MPCPARAPSPPRTDRLKALALTAGLSLALTPPVSAGPPPDYGFDWATIGAPRNRPVTPDEAPQYFPPLTDPPLVAGRVDYEFRMSRTEVTAKQWFEFVEAYWPYLEGTQYFDSSFTGSWIRPGAPGRPGPGYYIVPGAENRPIDPSWHFAARYVNWLHNGKQTERWAFESGAYDTSTFTRNPDGSRNDQRTHSPEAQFWIPTLDEWTKAMYYDPNKNGPGLEGYWLYPTTSDEPPVPGWPWEGGETSGGLPYSISGPYLDVGSYPDVMSPWGLLDGSGSEWEWLEWATEKGDIRGVKGSRQFYPFPELYDRLDWLSGNFPMSGSIGLRLVSAIPAPSGALVILASTLALSLKRNKK